MAFHCAISEKAILVVNDLKIVSQSIFVVGLMDMVLVQQKAV